MDGKKGGSDMNTVMDFRKLLCLFTLTGLFLSLSLADAADDVIRVGTFNRDALNIIAEAKGFHRGQGLRAELSLVNNSIDLMRNLREGKTDVIHTNADNVIAWTEGQGEDPQQHDFVIFMGGNQGVRQLLVIGPGIGGIGGLKGKVLAVDDPRTGYSSVLVYMLKKNGLVLNKDFTLKAFGNTKSRVDAISRGEASGALINMSEEEIGKKGFKIVGRSEDYVPVYARGVGAARRTWINQNEAVLIRYIRSIVRATDWILDPNNKEEALKILLTANDNSKSAAARMYEDAVNPTLGYTRGSRLDLEGIKTIIDLREAMGFMKPPLPPPSRYVDESFYKKALNAPADK
jgi:ABC-type nitrate/sulfonate/bicarbonate transport system substrate-binding protein